MSLKYEPSSEPQGMPEETRVAVQRENGGGVMKRVVRDRGIFPAGALPIANIK